MKDKYSEYKTTIESVSIAEAKSSFSEYISRVAYAGESILITKRGKAIANNLVLITGNTMHFRHIRDLQIENWLF